MYHYILTLFTNVCFSRNNGILNPKKTLVYDALVGFNKKSKSTLGYSRSTCSLDANRLYCLQATICIQLLPIVSRCHVDHDRIHTSIRWQVETSSMNSSQMQIYGYPPSYKGNQFIRDDINHLTNQYVLSLHILLRFLQDVHSPERLNKLRGLLLAIPLSLFDLTFLLC